MGDCAGQSCPETVPRHFLLAYESRVNIREVVKVDKGDRVIHIGCRIVSNFIVLANGCVDRPDVEQGNEQDQIKHRHQEDRSVLVDLTLTVFLLAVGVRNECASSSQKARAD